MPPKLFTVRTSQAHTQNIRSMAIGPRSGRVFASGGEDCLLILWSVTEETPVLKFGPFAHPITCCQFDHSEDIIAFGTEGGSLSMIDLDVGKTTAAWTVNDVKFTCLDIHPQTPEFVAAGDSTGRVYLFNIQQRNPIQQFNAHPRGSVTSVRICPQGNLLASSGSDRIIRLYDIESGGLSASIKANCLSFLSIAFHPLEKCIAAISEDRSVRLFDIEQNVEVQNGYVLGTSPPQCIQFSQDGEVLASCSNNYVDLYRTSSLNYSDHLQLNLKAVHGLQLYSTGVAIAASEGPNALIVMARTEDFRLLKKTTEKKRTKSTTPMQNKLIDGSDLLPRNKVSRRDKQIANYLAGLQPKQPSTPAPPPNNENIYKAFMTDRAGYTAILTKRLDRFGRIKTIVKRKGIEAAAKDVVLSNDGSAELLTILLIRPETLQYEILISIIPVINIAFEIEPILASHVLTIILDTFGNQILTTRGDEDTQAIIAAMKEVGPSINAAAADGCEQAKNLVTNWRSLF